MKNTRTLPQAITLVTFSLLAISAELRAATWTNFLGDLRWGTAVNWSPNTAPNAAGAVADFQVDFPSTMNISVRPNGSGTSYTPLISTLKLGDTNGSSGISLIKEISTCRIDWTNAAGGLLVEKRGDGNDVVSVGRW